MKKADVLRRLSDHLEFGEIRWKGDRSFAKFFRWWLRRLAIPADEKYSFYDLTPFLPQLAVNAWEEMRIGTDAETIGFRNGYESEVERPMPRLMVLDEDILEQFSAVSCIGRVLQAAAEDQERMKGAVDTYCRAQHHAIQGVFDKFLREVYGKGLFEIIRDDRARGMKGKFGATELRTWVCAGRTMFTFARPKKKGDEVSITFIAGDDDALALEAGIQSVYATLPTAMDMIEEVIRQWPKEKQKQLAKFRGDDNVAPDVVHAMRAQAAAR